MRTSFRTAVLLSVILIGGWSCTPKKQPNAEDYFFPRGTLDRTRSDSDKFCRDWYSKHLRAMQEPSLSSGKRTADSVYRFLWLRTWHHPIAVRIEITGSVSVLYAIELDGDGGYEPGQVARQVTRALSAAEQEKVMARLKSAGFWQMTATGNDGCDGAEWILEGTRKGHYRVVQRWSPKTGDYRDVCLLFIELAGFSMPPTEIY